MFKKIYSNGFLKDAIKKRSICTKNIRFSHDRSSNNGPNDGKSKTSDPVNCANETATGEKFPDPPTTCCMSGCANCVWIQYAEEISSKLKNGSDVAREIIMKEVQDTNMRSFLEMELRMLKIREKK